MFRRDYEGNTSGKIKHIDLCEVGNNNVENLDEQRKQQQEQESNGKLVKTLELQSGDILAEGSFEFSSEKDR